MKTIQDIIYVNSHYRITITRDLYSTGWCYFIVIQKKRFFWWNTIELPDAHIHSQGFNTIEKAQEKAEEIKKLLQNT